MSILDYGGFDDEPEDEERRREKFEEELRRFQDMLNDRAPDITNVEALEEIVAYYMDHEKYEEALHFINQLLSLIPYSAENWQRKGVILSNLFKYEEALDCYSRALEVNPEKTTAAGATWRSTASRKKARATRCRIHQ